MSWGLPSERCRPSSCSTAQRCRDLRDLGSYCSVVIQTVKSSKYDDITGPNSAAAPFSGRGASLTSGGPRVGVSSPPACCRCLPRGYRVTLVTASAAYAPLAPWSEVRGDDESEAGRPIDSAGLPAELSPTRRSATGRPLVRKAAAAMSFARVCHHSIRVASRRAVGAGPVKHLACVHARPASSAPGGAQVVDVVDKLTLFADQWSPRIVGQVNDMHVKVCGGWGGVALVARAQVAARSAQVFCVYCCAAPALLVALCLPDLPARQSGGRLRVAQARRH